MERFNMEKALNLINDQTDKKKITDNSEYKKLKSAWDDQTHEHQKAIKVQLELEDEIGQKIKMNRD